MQLQVIGGTLSDRVGRWQVLALSLGLVGALSIVRFRTAIKEPEELAFLFFAIGLGIGLGDNQRLITLLALAAGALDSGYGRLVMLALGLCFVGDVLLIPRTRAGPTARSTWTGSRAASPPSPRCPWCSTPRSSR